MIVSIISIIFWPRYSIPREEKLCYDGCASDFTLRRTFRVRWNSIAQVEQFVGLRPCIWLSGPSTRDSRGGRVMRFSPKCVFYIFVGIRKYEEHNSQIFLKKRGLLRSPIRGLTLFAKSQNCIFEPPCGSIRSNIRALYKSFNTKNFVYI